MKELRQDLSWKLVALCAATLMACQAVPHQERPTPLRASQNSGGAAERSARQDPATTADEAFHNWAYSLPAETNLPPMTGTITMRMSGDLARMSGGELDPAHLPVGANTDFAMDLVAHLDIESWRRMRARFDVKMKLGLLEAQSAEPIEMSVLLVADGEMLWLEPDWSKAWFLDQLRGQATGFERLVFNLKSDTLCELMEVVSSTMEGEAAEWYRASIECASNPAALARMLADQVDCESFSRKGNRVLVELSMDLRKMLPPETLNLSEDSAEWNGVLRYRSEFDAVTGAVFFTAYEFNLPEAGMNMSLLQEMQPAASAFPAEHFRYKLPEGRQAFPLDLFMKPIMTSIQMESGNKPPSKADSDLPF